MWQKGLQIYAETPEDEGSVQRARDYISRMNLTADDVKIVRREKQILVETKRDIPD